MIQDPNVVSVFWFLKSNKDNKPLEVFIPNGIFKKLNELDISGKQRAFAFALYVFIKVSNSKGYRYRISDIKEFWGYSRNNKSLNDLVKKNGMLDEAGITKTVIEGMDEFDRDLFNEEATKVQYKDIVYDVDVTKGKFFRIFSEMMLGCMLNNEEIGAIGFVIYSFICYKCQMKSLSTKSKSLYEWEHISIDYIAQSLGLSATSVKSSLKGLLGNGFIKNIRNYSGKYEKNRRYSKYDANSYLPSIVCPDHLKPVKSSNNMNNTESRYSQVDKYANYSKEDLMKMDEFMQMRRIERLEDAGLI